MKSLNSISDEWFDAICWSSLLLGIFMIKQCVGFSIIVLGTLKQDWDVKTSEMLSFLPLKNNSVTTGLNVLLAFISAIILSNTVNSFLFFVGFFSYFL